jgi:hypothetical protein
MARPSALQCSSEAWSAEQAVPPGEHASGSQLAVWPLSLQRVSGGELVLGLTGFLARLAHVQLAAVCGTTEVLGRAVLVPQAFDAALDLLIAQEADAEAILVAAAGRHAGVLHASVAVAAVAVDHARHTSADRAIADFATAAVTGVRTGLERHAFAGLTALTLAAIGVFATAHAQLLNRVAQRVRRVSATVGACRASLLREAAVFAAAMVGRAIPIVLAGDAAQDLITDRLFRAIAVVVAVTHQIAGCDRGHAGGVLDRPFAAFAPAFARTASALSGRAG